MSKLSRREQNKRDKRRRIRQAAWELFVERGYEDTTTAQVAREAGVAKGTLFLYATDKADLLSMVYRERLRDTVERAMAELPDGALLDQLLHVFEHVFAMYAEHPTIARDFIRALPGAKGINADALQAFTFGFVAQLATLISHAKNRGEVDRETDPLLAAGNVFSLYFGALLSWLNGYVAIEQVGSMVLARSLSLQMRGLAPRS